MNLTELQTQVAEWAKRNFPEAKPHQPLLGMTEETGELAEATANALSDAAAKLQSTIVMQIAIGKLSHAHLKLEQGIRGDKAEHYAAKVDAIGDLLIFAAHYCELNEISLASAARVTWDKVKLRDWQKNRKDGQS